MCEGRRLLLFFVIMGSAVILILYNHVLTFRNIRLPNIDKQNKMPPFFAIWSNQTFFKDYISDEFYELWKRLEDIHGWRQVGDFNPENRRWLVNDTITSYYNRYFNKIPDLILFVESYEKLTLHAKAPDWKSIRYRWLFIDDVHYFHHKDFVMRKNAMLSVEHVIGAYSYKIDVEYPIANSSATNEWSSYHRTWLPHSASSSFLVKYNRKPKKKILLAGAIDRFYPYRQIVFQMYKNMSGNRNNYIEYHPHPSYAALTRETRSSARRGFARIINRYFAVITDSSIKNYVIAKIFEIPAAGALLLLNSEVIPVLARLNWFENVHYVAYNKSNLEAVLLNVLSEKLFDKYEKIRWNGHQAALAFHTTSRRALFLHNLAMNTYLHG